MRELRKGFPAVTGLVSYQDADVHSGTIYRAAGWVPVVLPSRSEFGHWGQSKRLDGKRKALAVINKVRWEKALRPCVGDGVVAGVGVRGDVAGRMTQGVFRWGGG